MKHNPVKLTVFAVMGLAFGYFLHRVTLLYGSLEHLPLLERFNTALDSLPSELSTRPILFSFSVHSMIAFFVGFTIWLMAYIYQAVNVRNYRSGEEHGSARFGTKAEAKKFWSKKPENDIILSATERLTLTENKPLRYDRNKNTICFGGSGSGKTFRFVKPNIIQAACSYVVVDPKDHLAEKTGKFFLDQGYQIKIFDLVNMRNCHGFNPFRYVDTENDLNRILTTYFNNTKGTGTKSDPFWDESTMILVRAIASYLVDFYRPPRTPAEQERFIRLNSSEQEKQLNEERKKLEKDRERGYYPSFTEIGRLIKLLSKEEGQKRSVLEIMFDKYASVYGTENFTMRNWLDFQNYKDKTLDSVIAVATAKFATFNIQSVIDITEKDSLDILTWGTKKTIVYLVIPDNDKTFSFLAALFYSTVFNMLTRQADTVYKGKLPIHVRFEMDECANTGIITDFEVLMATVRSRNISLVPIFQDLPQLQGLYKEKEAWKTIIGNCDTLLYLGGNEKETFKFMSELTGKQTIDVVSTSQSYGMQGGGSVSHQKQGRELMTVDEIKNMPRDTCLVSIANVPIFKSQKYFPPKSHPNWKYLADDPDSPNWWDYDIAQLEETKPFDPSDHKTSDLNNQVRIA
ncbi:TPA: type IV secretory system conjugative DNA transfer family protein [Streptococcus suis]|nr:type IV secretory system conjugative DNA transfer family protein [Streptococcus suis]